MLMFQDIIGIPDIQESKELIEHKDPGSPHGP